MYGAQGVPGEYRQVGQPGIAGARLGDNGLYVVDPEPEEIHEAQQFMKLNVTEGVKYGEFWADVSKGEDLLPGKLAVPFLSRARDVTRSQLRLIWDLADHQKRGSLNKDEFFIALRLIALAQRGAELSVNGLRNFTGIQLIPFMDSAPAPPPPPARSIATTAAPPEQPLLVWQITPEQNEKYNAHFNKLDDRGMGYIDGLQGVTFFTISGLPRPVLKEIWRLADISADGKLDRDEFRQAMHLVTLVRRGIVPVENLPPRLDPSGPNWVRVMGDSNPSHMAPPGMMNPEENLLGDLGPTEMMGAGSFVSGMAPSSMLSPSSTHPSTQPPEYHEPSRRHADEYDSPGAPRPVAADPMTNPQLSSWQEDPESLRQRLRDAAMAEQRAKRQVEEMQQELERIRLEQSQISNAEAKRNKDAQVMRAEYQEMLKAKTEADRRINELESSTKSSAPKATQSMASTPHAHGQMARPTPGFDDLLQDDSLPNATNDRDSLSSDDDGDFWGTDSLKPPTMGPPGSFQSRTPAQETPKDDDDDWVF